ncbi:FadR/GntR family transcriptional regulator [Paenibacillus filicis]|uniref:FadR/GntR family transcriptional regulator n=1 Tax=Paenibacillus gyeongsangnamensis TaxID=3388067 RepID=A0ABT4QFI9_9BACL|nr:FadR/GntR family transcriptional regulator [Paenibacillus filicis]MCZ8515627.1 FadR/GntR family transcriptional regulator [Paenibacillus filicis]
MKKINKVRMHEMVSEELKEYIRSNDLKRGDKLPSAETIMKILGVGRSSLREALRYLEATDIVEVVNGKGIYVKETAQYHMSAKINIEDERSALLQLMEVRRALELLAVELAAQRSSEKHQEEMRRYLHEIETTRGHASSIADMKFHQAVYKASGNPILQSIAESVWELFSVFWNAPFGRQEIFQDSFPFHQTLFQAIVEKNPAKAREEFNKMMDSMEQSIKSV